MYGVVGEPSPFVSDFEDTRVGASLRACVLHTGVGRVGCEEEEEEEEGASGEEKDVAEMHDVVCGVEGSGKRKAAPPPCSSNNASSSSSSSSSASMALASPSDTSTSDRDREAETARHADRRTDRQTETGMRTRGGEGSDQEKPNTTRRIDTQNALAYFYFHRRIYMHDLHKSGREPVPPHARMVRRDEEQTGGAAGRVPQGRSGRAPFSCLAPC